MKNYEEDIQIVDGNIENDEYISLIPDIEYAKVGETSLKLHIMVRQNPMATMFTGKKSTEKFPLIIYIQGCGWGWFPQLTYRNLPQMTEFVRSGYVVASIQHRLTKEAIFPAQIHDVKAAVRFLKANAAKYNIDPDRIAVWGDSSGGHLATLLGVTEGVEELEGNVGDYPEQSTRVHAVVDWYGPSDIVQMSKFPSSVDHDAPNSPESMLVGGPVQENKEKAAKTNPINYLHKNVPPFLIMHGDQDTIVPYNQSILLFQALREVGADVTMYNVKGADHGVGLVQPHNIAIVKEFLDKHLR